MVVRKLVIAAALAASALAAAPTVALADGGDRGWHREYDDDDHDDDRGHRYYRYREPSYQDGPAYYRGGGYAEPRRYYRETRPRQSCRTKGTTGLILGGAAGALLGRELDRYGDRAPGTIIGAGAGALVGREIARKNRC